MVGTWVVGHSRVKCGCGIATQYCKFQERRNGGLQNRLLGQNKIKDYIKKGCRPIYTDYRPLPAGLSKQVKGLCSIVSQARKVIGLYPCVISGTS